MCITLRINDKVGGRRRSGYIRGCLSDIKYYNRSVLFYGDVMRTAYNPQNTRCQMVRLRDLFAAPEWYGFDSSDHVELCTCHSQVIILLLWQYTPCRCAIPLLIGRFSAT